MPSATHMPHMPHTNTQSGRQSAVLKGAWQKGFISVPPPHASQSIEAAAVWLLANCFSRTLFNYYVSPPIHTHTITQRHSLIKALLHIKLDYTVAVRLQLSDVACHGQMACQIRKHFVQMLPELRHTRAAPNRVWHFMMCPFPPPPLTPCSPRASSWQPASATAPFFGLSITSKLWIVLVMHLTFSTQYKARISVIHTNTHRVVWQTIVEHLFCVP